MASVPISQLRRLRALPIGPAALLVHIASVWVPFTSESKEAIASYDEIMKEIKLGLQELAFRGFQAALVAAVMSFASVRAFLREPLVRGPEPKTVEVMVSARSQTNLWAKGRAQERG